MKVVVFGGTFNPVHNGHLYIGEEIRNQLDYDKILYVPSNIPPHKEYSGSVSPFQRIAMLELALAESYAEIEKCEISRGGTSYTADTVDFLYRKYDIEGKVGLVVGDDLLQDFKSWYRWKELAELVDIIAVHRTAEERKQCDIPHVYLENLILPISSSDIRRRIRSGGAFRYLVPEPVYSYIKNNGLYLG